MSGGNIAGDRKGITILEIAIVIAIVGILAALAVSSFREMNEKYKVEEETKQLFVDLMDARGRAMQRGRFYFVRFTGTPVTRYATYEDCNPLPDGDCNYQSGLDNMVTGATITHTIVAGGGAANFAFNRNGIASTDSGTIRLSSNVNPDYDCITVRATRMKMGKYDAGTGICVEK
ncbi:MAG: prepilin-type N-terminal cleavage/methylation domain-containing protein [Deltaproteobacteria bacterium]|nr:prepilin-type N-terminal cleavage/methylation domain-containing protein [Deltaproteobacteria bacterium]PWB63349.1 MAG: hypothetical protein C3F14_08250 [Deltaproteobacteria bacterium]